MGLIHDQLYDQHEVLFVDMPSYVEALFFIEAIVEAFRLPSCHISTSSFVSPIRLPEKTAFHCGLIINELVSNAMEHAFEADRREHRP